MQLKRKVHAIKVTATFGNPTVVFKKKYIYPSFEIKYEIMRIFQMLLEKKKIDAHPKSKVVKIVLEKSDPENISTYNVIVTNHTC